MQSQDIEAVGLSAEAEPIADQATIRRVITASAVGTLFEWYDFYLYGSLAAIIGAQFFTAFPEATRNVFALLAFAAGFIVRPFGALVGSLPLVVLYAFFVEHYVSAMTGAVKE